jgi:REP element-mobilizing transposase RayT
MPCPESARMGHTYTNLLTHIIFSTKDRLPYLRGERRHDVFTYIGEIIRGLNGSALNVNGVDDHVHMLVRLRASVAVAKAVEIVKTNSSRWIHEWRIPHRSFAWQAGYAAFSVSESQSDEVSKYITNQQEHHRQITFQEELLAFLERSGVQYDERYIWR